MDLLQRSFQRPQHRALWLTLFVIALSSSAYGFDDQQTHPAITSAAIGASKLDATLKMMLGVNIGVEYRG
jgi:hypothetical protein